MRRWLMRLTLISALLLLRGQAAQTALLFDGVDDVISTTVTTGVPTTYPFAAAWVFRLTAINEWHTVVELGSQTVPDGLLIQIGDNNTLRLENSAAGGGVVSSTGTIPATTWVFCGVSSASSTSHRLYCWNYETQTVIFNETSASALGTIVAPTAGVYIGAVNWNSDFANFTLTWLAIYQKDLTIQNGDAFKAMAYLGPRVLANPSLLYTFNEMTGTTTMDRQGTTNTGTLTAFTAPWQPMSLPGPIAP